MTESERLEMVVDDFADRMKKKLLQKEDEGWSGWRRKVHSQDFEDRLIEHALCGIRGDSAQWVDVANFAAFLDYQARDHDEQER